MKLNVGCGEDYRKGFVNIDGSKVLSRVDKVIDISSESLLSHFREREVEYILANDIIEHHFHWQAIRILQEFYILLEQGGQVEIRVPDAELIINSQQFSTEKKLYLLFGGQDIPQGRSQEMDESRKKFPEFFCHKYAWTKKLLKKELSEIGFSVIQSKSAGINFVTYATK